jgi:hypothetical protein
MPRLQIATAVVVLLALTGCDKLPIIGKKSAGTTATSTVAARTDTVPKPAPADTTRPATTPARAPAPRAQPVLHDEPWTPVDTGTITPGMSRMQVAAVWGVPVAERTAGNWTYLYFRNGCEVSCGTFDVVFLQNDQVVDAIVRGPGHTYAGVSSSPASRRAEPTVPPTAPGTGAAP